jgi:kumamolisin
MSQSVSQSGQVASHIPTIVNRYSDRGKTPGETILPVTISLKLNHEDELDQRLAEMYQPGSSSYHQFMATGEFKARYAPTDEQVSAVQDYLISHGIQSASVDGTGYQIHASGTVDAMNEAFQTEIHQYVDANGNEYFAPAVEPTMPEGVSIQAVQGLHNVAKIRKHLVSPDVVPHVGSGPGGGMDPSDIRGAYSIPSSVTGSGQVLAVAEFDGYTASDISGYEREFGLSSVPLQNVYVDGATGTPGSGADEVTLDIELMIAMAPGASRIMVYEAPNSLQSVLDMYGKIANDNQAKIVSTSWGSPENEMSDSFLESENVIFKQMAAQGQSVFASAGDDGADDNGSSISVDDPASQPYVVAVGGTELNEVSGRYESETTWNNGSAAAGAGGGGISTVWSQPTWQSGVANSSNGASSSMRNVPDVSLNADPNTGYAIYLNGVWTIFGGTSASTPLWAGFTALVNEQRVNNGLALLGFLNPYLYTIGKGSRYGSDFHDIDDGSNNLEYRAVQGFDDATGWGSINGTGLFQDLSSDPAITPDLSC